jgi:hypothetical protein
MEKKVKQNTKLRQVGIININPDRKIKRSRKRNEIKRNGKKNRGRRKTVFFSCHI